MVKEKELQWCVCVACVVVSGSGRGGSMCALVVGSLGALSNAAVAWCG
jgi:hypothetical protein